MDNFTDPLSPTKANPPPTPAKHPNHINPPAPYDYSQQQLPQSPRPNIPSPRSPFSSDPILPGSTGSRVYEQHAARVARYSPDPSSQQHNSPSPPSPTHRPQPQSSQPAGASTQTQANPPEPMLRVRVLGLERQRKEAFVKMDASTNISSYHSSYIKPFTRSYTEFSALHSALAVNNPHTIVPALPLSHLSCPVDEDEERLLRIAYQHWFDRITIQQSFITDDELRMFLEDSYGYTVIYPRRSKQSTSSSSFPRFRSRSASTKDENEELGTAKYEVVRLESALSDVVQAVEKEAKNRRALATCIRSFADNLASYSTTETHKQSALTTKRLAGCLARVADIEARRSVDNMVTLGDVLAYEAQEAQEAKETLLQRQSVLENHRVAIKNSISKKRNLERLKQSSSIKPERSNEAIDELEEADRVERNLARRVQDISDRLAPSLREHMHQLNKDLLAALQNHGHASLHRESMILKDLENVLPDLYVIDSRPTAAEVVYASNSTVAATTATTPAILNANPTIHSSTSSPTKSTSVVTAETDPTTNTLSAKPPLSRSTSNPLAMSSETTPQTPQTPTKSAHQRTTSSASSTTTANPESALTPSKPPQQQQQQQQVQTPPLPPLNAHKPRPDGQGRLSNDPTRSVIFLPPNHTTPAFTPYSPTYKPQTHYQQQQQAPPSPSTITTTSSFPSGSASVMVDERKRVDAKMAASKLANLF